MGIWTHQVLNKHCGKIMSVLCFLLWGKAAFFSSHTFLGKLSGDPNLEDTKDLLRADWCLIKSETGGTPAQEAQRVRGEPVALVMEPGAKHAAPLIHLHFWLLCPGMPRSNVCHAGRRLCFCLSPLT